MDSEKSVPIPVCTVVKRKRRTLADEIRDKKFDEREVYISLARATVNKKMNLIHTVTNYQEIVNHSQHIRQLYLRIQKLESIVESLLSNDEHRHTKKARENLPTFDLFD